jgi:hypothetical protein
MKLMNKLTQLPTLAGLRKTTFEMHKDLVEKQHRQWGHNVTLSF